MIVPDSGAVAFDARDVTHLPMYKRARLGLGYLPQEQSIFRSLTVWQNLMAILETRPLNRKARIRRGEELLDQFGLQKVRNSRAGLCSGGEKRKIEIARALITDPKLILLDEPFSAVDPLAVEDLQREVLRLKHEFRKSILIIDGGRVFREGTPKQIINDPEVRQTYLGSIFRGDEFD
jgi:lipopolysaccharide export system ATP-binding protein